MRTSNLHIAPFNAWSVGEIPIVAQSMLKLYVYDISLIVGITTPLCTGCWRHFRGMINIDQLCPAQDIQMLKFGQIVDLDLIERSAPNKYVQESKMGENWTHEDFLK